MTRSLGRSETPDEIDKWQFARGRIEALRGQPPQRNDDLRAHQGDFSIQMPRAERDLRGRRGAIPFPSAACRRSREALGETGQVEVTMQRLTGKPGPLKPTLQRASGGAGIR